MTNTYHHWAVISQFDLHHPVLEHGKKNSENNSAFRGKFFIIGLENGVNLKDFDNLEIFFRVAMLKIF